MNKRTITDLDIQALIDGDLEEERALGLLETIMNDPALYNRYLVYQKQKKLLKAWWKDN